MAGRVVPDQGGRLRIAAQRRRSVRLVSSPPEIGNVGPRRGMLMHKPKLTVIGLDAVSLSLLESFAKHCPTIRGQMAPTICYAAGLPTPRNATGAVRRDLLA